MKFKEGERKHLKQLVQDCIIYGLDERESLLYIKSRFGQPMSASYFYQIQNRLQSDEECRMWLFNFAKVGYVEAHKERIDEMLRLRETCFRMLVEERAKPLHAAAKKRQPRQRRQDHYLILAICDEIAKINKRLAQLQAGSPILAQMKAMLEQQNADVLTTTSDDEEEREFKDSPQVLAALRQARA